MDKNWKEVMDLADASILLGESEGGEMANDTEYLLKQFYKEFEKEQSFDIGEIAGELVPKLEKKIKKYEQEIEIQTINARTYLQEAEELQIKIKQLKESLKEVIKYSCDNCTKDYCSMECKIREYEESEVEEDGSIK